MNLKSNKLNSHKIRFPDEQLYRPLLFFFKTQLFTPSNETKSKLWKNKKTKSNPKCSLHSSQLCAMNGVEKKRKEKVVLWMRINLTCYCGLMKRKKVGLKGLICLTVGFFREMIWKVACYWLLHSNTPTATNQVSTTEHALLFHPFSISTYSRTTWPRLLLMNEAFLTTFLINEVSYFFIKHKWFNDYVKIIHYE